MTMLADLPVEVQMDLREKRALVTGWEPFTQATPEQWMTYYQILNAPAREYLVTQLLELAQKGSQCFEAEHDASAENFWQQLRGVVDLHNARVDEVAQLQAENARLRAIITDDVDLLERARAAERAEHPSRVLEGADLQLISVNFTHHPLPGQELYVTRAREAGHDGQ